MIKRDNFFRIIAPLAMPHIIKFLVIITHEESTIMQNILLKKLKDCRRRRKGSQGRPLVFWSRPPNQHERSAEVDY